MSYAVFGLVRKVVVPTIAMFVLSACAYVPHDVGITAKAPTEPSSIGKGVNLVIEVLDDREVTDVGRRGAKEFTAEITSTQVMPSLKRELINGFRAKGFTIVESPQDADAEVEARLRAFTFYRKQGLWDVTENASVAVAIEGKRDRQDYDRIYRSSVKDPKFIAVGSDAIDQKLNSSLSEVLRQIFSDKKLLGLLADQ